MESAVYTEELTNSTSSGSPSSVSTTYMTILSIADWQD